MLKTKIEHCSITDEIHKIFTLEKQEYFMFKEHKIPDNLLPDNFSIGLIVGSSGSGKSLLLKKFGDYVQPKWKQKAIASHFKDFKDCEDRLMGAGLNSIPTWLAPYNILSNGQKYRADVARNLDDGSVFDEFTSVIDRNTAKSLSNSIQKYIRNKNLKSIVFACPHHDIEEYLKPDWVYDTDTKKLTVNAEFYKELNETEYLDKKYIKIDNQKKVHFMEIIY